MQQYWSCTAMRVLACGRSSTPATPPHHCNNAIVPLLAAVQQLYNKLCSTPAISSLLIAAVLQSLLYSCCLGLQFKPRCLQAINTHPKPRNPTWVPRLGSPRGTAATNSGTHAIRYYNGLYMVFSFGQCSLLQFSEKKE